jgi:hypothetical protein
MVAHGAAPHPGEAAAARCTRPRPRGSGSLHGIQRGRRGGAHDHDPCAHEAVDGSGDGVLHRSNGRWKDPTDSATGNRTVDLLGGDREVAEEIGDHLGRRGDLAGLARDNSHRQRLR